MANRMNSARAAATGAAFQKSLSSSFRLLHAATIDRDLADATPATFISCSSPASSTAKTGSLNGFQIGQSDAWAAPTSSSACISLAFGCSASATSLSAATDCELETDSTVIGSALISCALCSMGTAGIGPGATVSSDKRASTFSAYSEAVSAAGSSTSSTLAYTAVSCG